MKRRNKNVEKLSDLNAIGGGANTLIATTGRTLSGLAGAGHIQFYQNGGDVRVLLATHLLWHRDKIL